MLSDRRVRVFSFPFGPAFAGSAESTGRALAVAVGCSLAGLMGGCSIAVPIAGFSVDNAPTGTIARADALLFNALDQEDGRRARAALAVALDPQGNGESVAWNNPQSGAKGTFAANGAPFSHDTRICRAFTARVNPAPRAERVLAGSACRNSEGEWLVSEAHDEKDAKG